MSAPPSGRRTGRVKFFNSQKGFGFIIPSESSEANQVDEIFVHHTAIHNDGGFKSLAEVEYDVVPGPKGMQAANVTGPGGVSVRGDPNAGRGYGGGRYGGYGGGGYGGFGGPNAYGGGYAAMTGAPYGQGLGAQQGYGQSFNQQHGYGIAGVFQPGMGMGQFGYNGGYAQYGPPAGGQQQLQQQPSMGMGQQPGQQAMYGGQQHQQPPPQQQPQFGAATGVAQAAWSPGAGAPGAPGAHGGMPGGSQPH
ncbi:Y box binding protein 1 [Actinomortierella ambigua]|uniref:Y box binding protein 1 n=1 Tax=Actinomortierella ambigua TaxID=1343610 RepID=A0A9P6U4V5_9FUNG|nr:Y box binding protein 1 [Actinomortierella ambigua]